MRSVSLFILLLIFSFGKLSAQDNFLVIFSDKPDLENWDCSAWLAPQAIQRRLKHGLACHDISDLPLSSDYVSAVAKRVDSVRYELRWWNGISVRANEAQLDSVRELPFVAEIIPLGGLEKAPIVCEWQEAENREMEEEDYLDDLQELVRAQMEFGKVEAAGLAGEGIIIALFDAGFKGADTHPGLKHLSDNQQILEVQDFYRGKDQVFYHSDHGTATLSCIAGRKNDKAIGLGQKASFLLARTESLFWEKEVEEDHWLAAAEWAERKGASIISSSLGYSEKRYVYEHLDGRSTPVTQAAAMATRKGVLVINSIGNEGNKKFKFLSAPADADSVLAVGASFPMIPMAMQFSSFGPNARGVMKPDITAPGYATVCGKKDRYRIMSGTSFSCPLVTGMVACMMERHPEATNMEILRMVREAGHLYPYYDYRHGTGVLRASGWLGEAEAPDTCDLRITELNGDTLLFSFPEIKVEDSTDEKGSRVLYFHQERAPGRLMDYRFALAKPRVKGMKWAPVGEPPFILRIHFEGCLYEREYE